MQHVAEKDELLRQVNEATNKAREATEQCAALRLEMELKNDTIQKLHQQLFKQVQAAFLNSASCPAMKSSHKGLSARSGQLLKNDASCLSKSNISYNLSFVTV
jgi:hypothetical protein